MELRAINVRFIKNLLESQITVQMIPRDARAAATIYSTLPLRIDLHFIRSPRMATNIKPVHIIGAGLAGSEAAWQCVSRGVPVVLHEMRPKRMTDAHETDGFAELVCSNSCIA